MRPGVDEERLAGALRRGLLEQVAVGVDRAATRVHLYPRRYSRGVSSFLTRRVEGSLEFPRVSSRVGKRSRVFSLKAQPQVSPRRVRLNFLSRERERERSSSSRNARALSPSRFTKNGIPQIDASDAGVRTRSAMSEGLKDCTSSCTRSEI